MRVLNIFSFFFDKETKNPKNYIFWIRETLEKRSRNGSWTRVWRPKTTSIFDRMRGLHYACFSFCGPWVLQKALAPEESDHRQDDDFGSKTAKKRLRNGWVAATASKTTSIFEPIGVLTRYQTSALKVYWSSSLSARRIWGPDCNISIENLDLTNLEYAVPNDKEPILLYPWLYRRLNATKFKKRAS